jgi:hypothetical protein
MVAQECRKVYVDTSSTSAILHKSFNPISIDLKKIFSEQILSEKEKSSFTPLYLLNYGIATTLSFDLIPDIVELISFPICFVLIIKINNIYP